MALSNSEQTRLVAAFKVLGEPTRLRILCGLGLECRPVMDIIQATGMGQTHVSFHLRMLREAGLVRAERRGPFIYYCLADPSLPGILQELANWLDARQIPPTKGASRPGRPGAATATKTLEVRS